MRIAISNIAWDASEDDAVAQLLQRYRIDAIDVALPKYFQNLQHVVSEDLFAIKRRWSNAGIEVTGMQSLMFGTSGLNLFGSADTQAAMLAHLSTVCRCAAGLGATRLVFGSPKNRDRSGLSDTGAERIAIPFFRQLGDIAKLHGVAICLEPNPPSYGANFMTTSAETARVVREVAHTAIRMQLDTGALAINREDAAQVVQDNAALIGHIHASEPQLVPLGDGGADHDRAADAVRRSLPNHLVSIEMVATQNEPHLASIERALNVAIRSYRDDPSTKGGVA